MVSGRALGNMLEDPPLSLQQTKSHNFNHRPWQLVTVVLGAHDLLSPEPGQQKLTITQVFQNNYNPEETLNDVLLLQVGWVLRIHSCRRHLGYTYCAPCWDHGAVIVWDPGLSLSFCLTWLCFLSVALVNRHARPGPEVRPAASLRFGAKVTRAKIRYRVRMG